MILDQDYKKKEKRSITGNNNLLQGSVFALITFVWFFFQFAFINMEWEHFSPASPWIFGLKEKEHFIFYFIAFSFFISSIIYSLIFYRRTLQPNDLLMRFAIILVTFTVVWLIYSLFKYGMFIQGKMLGTGMSIITTDFPLRDLINHILVFLFLFLFFYPLVMVFSKLLFNGEFGSGGFILCAFLALIFHLSLHYLASMEIVLLRTKFPVHDLIIILFFTLMAFGVGVLSGKEEKRSVLKGKGKNSLRNLTDRH